MWVVSTSCDAEGERQVGVAVVVMCVGALACSVATYLDRLVASKSLKAETAVSWLLLLLVFWWRVEMAGWPSSVYWAGAGVYWSLLAWTGFRPFFIAPRLWTEGARSKPGRVVRARVSQVGFGVSMVAIGAWAVAQII